MLAQKNRLRKKADFEKVYKNGTFFSAGNLSVKIIKNFLNFCRIGFVVSAKFSKKAVERNRAKRQLREIFNAYPELPQRAVDVVVMIKKVEKTTFSDLAQNVEKLLKKAKLIA